MGAEVSRFLAVSNAAEDSGVLTPLALDLQHAGNSNDKVHEDDKLETKFSQQCSTCRSRKDLSYYWFHKCGAS